MSRSKIKKSPFSKAFREAADGPALDDVPPPAELKHRSGPSSADGSLLTATIDGQECQLPFEVLGQSPAAAAAVPHLDETGISRRPFQCPVGGCDRSCSLLMFDVHITFDHADVLLESLWPSETNTVLIDTHVPPGAAQPRCHRLYLVSGKVRGLGGGKHRDKLPFALMSSKLTLHGGTEWLVLWVTGPDAGGDQRQRYTLEAGRNDPRRLLPYAVAFTGGIVPLHSSQDAEEVHRAGAGLVIAEQQIDFLADRATNLLEVCIHFH